MANDTATRLLTRIRELREARSLTQEAFAERAGLTYKHYQQVESGRKFDIRLSTLIKIAGGLGMKLTEVMDLSAPVQAGVGEEAAKNEFRGRSGKAAKATGKRRAGASQ